MVNEVKMINHVDLRECAVGECKDSVCLSTN